MLQFTKELETSLPMPTESFMCFQMSTTRRHTLRERKMNHQMTEMTELSECQPGKTTTNYFV